MLQFMQHKRRSCAPASVQTEFSRTGDIMKRAVLFIVLLALLTAALPVFAQSSLTAEQQEAVQVVDGD
jgi:hypothetical protein